MRKILKITLTLMLAMFTFVGAFAQDPTDFANAADDGDVSYVTVNKTMPFYAVPDNNYHPS